METETENQTPEPNEEPSHSGAEETTEGEVNGPNQSVDSEPELEQSE